MGNGTEKDIKSFFDNIAGTFKQSSYEREFALLQKDGCLKFSRPEAVKAFVDNHPDWKKVDNGGTCLFYPPKEYYEAMKLVLLCRKYMTNTKDNLSFIVKMKNVDDGQCDFMITYYNDILNEISVLYNQSIYCDNYFLSILLPTLYSDMLHNGNVDFSTLGNSQSAYVPVDKLSSNQLLLFVGFDNERMKRINIMKKYVDGKLNLENPGFKF